MQERPFLWCHRPLRPNRGRPLCTPLANPPPFDNTPGSGPPSQYTAFQPRRVALRFARSDELNSPAPKPSRSSASSIASLRKFYFLALPPRGELCPPVWYRASWGGMCVQLSTPPLQSGNSHLKLGVRGLVIKPRAARGMALIIKNRAARESFLENG